MTTTQARTTAPWRGASDEAPERHVLVAASDAALCSAVEAELREAGYCVAIARTGFEAIVKATCNLPDVIVLHDRLPGLGAEETARMLATCPTTARIPVVRMRAGRRLPKAVFTQAQRRAI